MLRTMGAAVIAAVALCGCVTAPPLDVGPAPTCSSPGECEFRWGLARRFVLDNCGFRLQTYTPDFMETYNPTDSSPRLGAQVSKDPLGGGKFELRARFYCANLFGCDPPADQTLGWFNSQVGTAAYAPPPAGQ